MTERQNEGAGHGAEDDPRATKRRLETQHRRTEEGELEATIGGETKPHPDPPRRSPAVRPVMGAQDRPADCWSML